MPRRPWPQLRAVPVDERRREAGIAGADAAAARGAGLPGRAARARARLPARWSPTARCVPPSALEIPRLGWVNLHFSLLPAWRGAAPVQHAVLAGDEVTGATTFLLEEGLDTGPVFGVAHRDRSGRPTPPVTCWAGWPTAGAGLLVATLDGIEDGELTPVPQPADGV